MNKKRLIWMKNEKSRWWHWIYPKNYSHSEYGINLSMYRWGCWIILRGPEDIIAMVEKEATNEQEN